MDDILLDIILIITLCLKISGIYFLCIAAFAVFKPRGYQKMQPFHRFAVLIAARNEQNVIGQLVESLKAQNYPDELYDIYVIPNNCTDDTAGQAMRSGANVIYCPDYVKNKGSAIRYALSRLTGRKHDAYCVFDADNIVHPDFLMSMNDAFCAGARVAKGRTVAHNAHDSWIAGCYGIYFGMFNCFYNRARAVCGLSAKLIGTGFAFRRDFIEETGGWNTVTMAEDAEFSAECALRGERIFWVPAAIAYDEEPNSFMESLIQRRRWCGGIVQVAKMKLPELLRSVRSRGGQFAFDAVMFLTVPFVQVISFAGLLTSLCLSITSELPGTYTTLVGMVATIPATYLSVVLLALITTICDRTFSPAIVKSILAYPIFIMSFLPLQIIAMLRKPTVWAATAHSGYGKNKRMLSR